VRENKRYATALGIGSLIVAIVGPWLYTYKKMMKTPATGNPDGFVVEKNRRLVACLGDSITHGVIGADYVTGLRRLLPADTQVVNAGINADFAYNLKERLDAVLRLRPAIAVVLIGTNDAMGLLHDSHYQILKDDKNLPQLPTMDFFRKNFSSILTRLRKNNIRTAVCTIPPLGEVPDSRSNRQVSEINGVIKEVAQEKACDVLPLNEALWDVLREESEYYPLDYPAGYSKLWYMLVGGYYHYVLGVSNDRIARWYGNRLLPDFIHLGETAGAVMTRLVADFVLQQIDKNPRRLRAC